MEILTTMIKFRCRKSAMSEQTSSSYIFKFDNGAYIIKIFVPKSKLIVRQDKKMTEYNECIIPKCVFMKTKNLKENVDVVRETQHVEIIEDINN